MFVVLILVCLWFTEKRKAAVPSGASQNDFGASVLASAIMTHLATGDLSVGNFEAYIRDFTFVWLIPL